MRGFVTTNDFVTTGPSPIALRACTVTVSRPGLSRPRASTSRVPFWVTERSTWVPLRTLTTYAVTGRSPLRWDGAYGEPGAAPVLGRDTEQVLTEVLGLTDAELGRLRGAAVIA